MNLCQLFNTNNFSSYNGNPCRRTPAQYPNSGATILAISLANQQQWRATQLVVLRSNQLSAIRGLLPSLRTVAGMLHYDPEADKNWYPYLSAVISKKNESRQMPTIHFFVPYDK
ncbi:hypothetical protein CBL_03644 [Carabus blaptoides fortunei]